ncbi:MAG: hypothetical protein ABW019_05080, partial [Chitinophagaceae bacterium]
MKKILLALCFIVLHLAMHSQDIMPPYPEVMKAFFLRYSYEPAEPYDKLMLAKKKDGWYVHTIDQLNKDSVKTEQLFWSLRKASYLPLTGFGPGMDEKEATAQLLQAMESDTWMLYNYDRCRYAGYNTWDADMIRDFSNLEQAGDTLMEGLAKAYSYHACRYLWYTMGGTPYDDDTLKRPLSNLEMPGAARIERFLYYTNKAIGYYQQLHRQNPGYKLVIGTPQMKILNEQFYQYQQLWIAGYTTQAKQILDRISSGDTLYHRIGHTYLDACPANAILITYGDNDTYPLWYVQQKEGFRKDVTVINNNLLGVPAYVQRLKQAYPRLFTTNVASFRDIYSGYFLLDEEKGRQDDTLSLASLLQQLQSVTDTIVNPVGTMATYPAQNILLQADTNRLKKMTGQANLASRMNIRLNSYLLLADFLILDMLHTNLYTRPVCMVVNTGMFHNDYLQRQGPVYRILPLNNNRSEIKLASEIATMEAFLEKNPSPVVITFSGNPPCTEELSHGLYTGL